MIYIKSKEEIKIMRESCRLAVKTLDDIEGKLRVGMTTEEVDQLCHDYITKHGAYPSPLNYKGFPKSVCTSKNEVICHGIPAKNVILNDGDILNIDVTTYLNGFHGDTNRTFLIGNVSEGAKTLVKVTRECMMIGIEQVKPGNRLGDIGAAIQAHAEKHGYSVVRDFCGHGIGRNFHEDPQVLHYGERGTGLRLKPGMTFTIEPMINIGKPDVKILKDGWTAVTTDGKWSAQFEHTILVTETGHEILTL